MEKSKFQDYKSYVIEEEEKNNKIEQHIENKNNCYNSSDNNNYIKNKIN